jgi:flagellar biosynthesis GTPase FlhF
VDDIVALAEAMELKPFHLVGHSLGGMVCWGVIGEHPQILRTATLIAPGPPMGFGGIHGKEGTPNNKKFTGSGGGIVVDKFAERIKEKDRTADDPLYSPRNAMNRLFWKNGFKAEREEAILTAKREKAEADKRAAMEAENNRLKIEAEENKRIQDKKDAEAAKQRASEQAAQEARDKEQAAVADAKQAKIDAERAEERKKAEAERAKVEKQLEAERAERKKIDDERIAKENKERIAKEQAAKAEQDEAKRLSQAGDKEKLQVFMHKVRLLRGDIPDLQDMDSFAEITNKLNALGIAVKAILDK